MTAPDATLDLIVAEIRAVRADLAELRRELTDRAELVAEAEADPVAAALAELRTRCAEVDINVTARGTVTERGAADLLGFSRFTLRGWRLTDGRIPWRRTCGRVEYRVCDLAAFIASRTETAEEIDADL